MYGYVGAHTVCNRGTRYQVLEIAYWYLLYLVCRGKYGCGHSTGSLLHQHPSVIRTKIEELQYFHELPIECDGSGVHVDQARQFFIVEMAFL